MDNYNKKIDESSEYLNNVKNNKKIIEPFDGIRKDKSRVIFGILLIIIIIDTVIECTL